MSTKTQNFRHDRDIVNRYMDQPAVMPGDLRHRIEDLWDGKAVQLYSYSDLDESLKLNGTWVALGENHIAVAAHGNGEVKSIARDQIKAIHHTSGLSCSVISIEGDSQEKPLLVLRYTHRQRRAMENIKFVIEEQLKGKAVSLSEPDELYLTSISQAIKEAQASVVGHRLSVIWRLIGYLNPYRGKVMLGMIAAILLTALNLLPPYLTGILIDNIVLPFHGGDMTGDEAMRYGTYILITLAVTFLFRNFFVWIRLRTLAVVGEYVARDLRDEIYEHLQKLSLSYFSKKQTGSIISRVSSDTDRLWDFIAFGVVEVSLSILMLLGLAVVLISLDVTLGLLMVLPMPLLIGAIYLHGRRMNKMFLRIWRKWSTMMSVLSDTIPGMRVVKAFNREQYESQRFGKRNKDVLTECCNIHTIWTGFWPKLLTAFHALTLMVWILAIPRLVSNGENSLTLGVFATFLLYMGMFIHPIENIGLMTRMLNRATTSAYRVFEVLDTNPKIVDKPDSVKLQPVKGKIVFENVTFAYDQVRQIIKGISMEVQPGEMIGLVGPSGAGKTTIINLIARFYDVTGGKIMIDDVDIRDLNTGIYRRQVGMVHQDPYLFHGTILENIRYGLPGATIEQIIESSRAANAHDFICNLPHGYDTVVGERGHTLSGGERQRVSIARALLCNPRILILDEATSSVDTETEKKIQEALDHLIPGRTVFAIAHRLSTLRRASRLLVIDDGRIVEEGTHSELLQEKDGIYRKMYKIQQELHEKYVI